MFFNMEQKDLAFIKQPITKKKDGTNEPGLNSPKKILETFIDENILKRSLELSLMKLFKKDP